MSLRFGAAVLAAGQGKRLKLDLPKPLAPAVGKCLVDFPISECSNFFQKHSIDGLVGVVTGHRRDEVEAHISKTFPNNNSIAFTVQKEQLGTADALKAYFEIPKAKETDYTLVLCADTPLIRAKEIDKLYEILVNKKLDAVAATFMLENPFGYGRIKRATKGFSIVEEKDGTSDERKIKEVNSGFYLFKTSYVLDFLDKVDCKNKSGEFYLTDVFKEGRNVHVECFPDPSIFQGVNDLQQLEEVETALLKEKIQNLRNNGVRFIRSETSYIEWDVEIGEGSVVEPHTVLKGKTTIGKNVVIEAGSYIVSSVIAANVEIHAYSTIEKSKVDSKVAVGPYARLRPDTYLEEGVKIGNFVETKKTHLKRGAKVSHLSYVGDAEVGERSNIGCGFITCNYDGANKHKTTIGNDSFIGSDSQAIAPVTIGNNCYVASGSTITQNMPDGSFAISRQRQTTKEGMASRFMKKKGD